MKILKYVGESVTEVSPEVDLEIDCIGGTVERKIIYGYVKICYSAELNALLNEHIGISCLMLC